MLITSWGVTRVTAGVDWQSQKKRKLTEVLGTAARANEAERTLTSAASPRHSIAEYVRIKHDCEVNGLQNILHSRATSIAYQYLTPAGGSPSGVRHA